MQPQIFICKDTNNLLNFLNENIHLPIYAGLSMHYYFYGYQDEKSANSIEPGQRLHGGWPGSILTA